MFELNRQVRFSINSSDPPPPRTSANGYAGVPALEGFGHYLALDVRLRGDLDPASAYVVNIKEIDKAVREVAVPHFAANLRAVKPEPPARVLEDLLDRLNVWPKLHLDRLTLHLSPFTTMTAQRSDRPAIRLSQKFEFSATHRLHNPHLSDEENGKLFGKCNNPHGHGHNYELQVTLAGVPDANGQLIEMSKFESVVSRTVIDKFAHRNLDIEVLEFRDRIPTVENIAQTIYRLLEPQFRTTGARLASVTVWETPKTWCEYGED